MKVNIDISICHNKGEKVAFVWSEKQSGLFAKNNQS